jgi:hypothetical protein
MSKLTLNGKEKKSYLTIEADPLPVHIANAAAPMANAAILLQSINIGPTASMTLAVDAAAESINNDATTPARILVNGPFDIGPFNIDVLSGHSLCISKTLVPTKVTMFDGSGILTIEDISDAPIEVSMGLCVGSTLNVIHSGHNYSLIISPETIDISNYEANSLTIEDVNKFVTICSTLDGLIKNTNPFPLDKVCFLRDYQKLDHSLVEAFMNQNNLMPVCVIDQFITEHFFEFSAIAHSLQDSTLMDSLGSYDPIAEICSYVRLDEVRLQGDQPNNEDAN